ncbi:hypothetical protein GCM10010387_37090 [Streptomyces inusitatus]|uniref:Uncharacterized protein n=1 Tax=Streptomyces inusitatus TaxID=68221 RepID=A0A918QA10_9ACTN|nr:hypothetical protein [Streptomyces inusitatus]GGZ39451.1 hypothetical protein GCM10010387_37090 [Streptomyces inusitatus]
MPSPPEQGAKVQIATKPFRLNSFRGAPSYPSGFEGWRGTSPELGDVSVTYPFRPGEYELSSIVQGEGIPTVRYHTKGLHVVSGLFMPTLNRGTLRVGEDEVTMSRNRLGVTEQSRALHLTHGGDEYRLWAISRLHYALARKPSGERPGVTVQVEQSGKHGMRAMKSGRMHLSFTIEGCAEPTDIALAVMFSGVDRSTLTAGGSVRAMFARGSDQAVELGTGL